MAVAWYIVPYKRSIQGEIPTRYPAIDDYTPDIYRGGGQWAETEILGDRCLVKVRTSDVLLTILDAVYTRLPKADLADSLTDLSPAANTALQQAIKELGYTSSEITAALGDCTAVTLGDVLRFAASRRLKPRYDPKTDRIILDGDAQSCRPVDEVDAEVVDELPTYIGPR